MDQTDERSGLILPPLEEIDELFKEILNDTVGEDDEIVKNHNITIYKKDMKSLTGLKWLTDNVIDYYSEMINQRATRSGRKNFHIFHVHWIRKMTKELQNSEKFGSSGSLSRWSKDMDIFSFKYLIFPMNLYDSHWAVAVVQTEKRRIVYYDSWDSPQANGALQMELILKYLKLEYRKQENCDLPGNWRTIKADDIPVIVPKQDNVSDCGPFTLMFAERSSRGIERMNFTQEDMPKIRLQIMYEIYRNQLIPVSEDEEEGGANVGNLATGDKRKAVSDQVASDCMTSDKMNSSSGIESRVIEKKNIRPSNKFALKNKDGTRVSDAEYLYNTLMISLFDLEAKLDADAKPVNLKDHLNEMELENDKWKLLDLMKFDLVSRARDFPDLIDLMGIDYPFTMDHVTDAQALYSIILSLAKTAGMNDTTNSFKERLQCFNTLKHADIEEFGSLMKALRERVNLKMKEWQKTNDDDMDIVVPGEDKNDKIEFIAHFSGSKSIGPVHSGSESTDAQRNDIVVPGEDKNDDIEFIGHFPGLKSIDRVHSDTELTDSHLNLREKDAKIAGNGTNEQTDQTERKEISDDEPLDWEDLADSNPHKDADQIMAENDQHPLKQNENTSDLKIEGNIMGQRSRGRNGSVKEPILNGSQNFFSQLAWKQQTEWRASQKSSASQVDKMKKNLLKSYPWLSYEKISSSSHKSNKGSSFDGKQSGQEGSSSLALACVPPELNRKTMLLNWTPPWSITPLRLFPQSVPSRNFPTYETPPAGTVSIIPQEGFRRRSALDIKRTHKIEVTKFIVEPRQAAEWIGTCIFYQNDQSFINLDNETRLKIWLNMSSVNSEDKDGKRRIPTLLWAEHTLRSEVISGVRVTKCLHRDCVVKNLVGYDIHQALNHLARHMNSYHCSFISKEGKQCSAIAADHQELVTHCQRRHMLEAVYNLVRSAE